MKIGNKKSTNAHNSTGKLGHLSMDKIKNVLRINSTAENSVIIHEPAIVKGDFFVSQEERICQIEAEIKKSQGQAYMGAVILR